MIVKVENSKELKRFIYCVKDLYADDSHYIFPLFSILYKELKKEVLQDKKYIAILSYDFSGNIQGRLLYTMESDLKADASTCFWSYFESVNSNNVSNELFSYMETDMLQNSVYYSEGSFTPYDPDNRRGILVNGFDSDPIIFTSYNKDYYQCLLEEYGYVKQRDTYSIKPVISDSNERRLNKLGNFFEKKYRIDVNSINLKNVSKEIEDIHQILLEADNEHIYQDAPSIDLIKDVAKNLKFFLDERIIKIARERDTLKPVGFTFCLLDYNQVFKRTKGRIRPLKILYFRRKITRARGMMQYVIPMYQGTGLIGYMYKKLYEEFKVIGLTDFEGGTMMEGNTKTLTSFSKFGGKIYKTYRIYGKVIQK